MFSMKRKSSYNSNHMVISTVVAVGIFISILCVAAEWHATAGRKSMQRQTTKQIESISSAFAKKIEDNTREYIKCNTEIMSLITSNANKIGQVEGTLDSHKDKN